MHDCILQILMSVHVALIIVIQMRTVRTHAAPFCAYVMRDSEAMDKYVKVSHPREIKCDKVIQ